LFHLNVRCYVDQNICNISAFSRIGRQHVSASARPCRHGAGEARELAVAHSRSSPVNTAEGVFRLADDLRRERVSEGVDRIMASPVAVDRRPIRVITGWHLPGRDHNDNGCFAGKTSSYTLSVPGTRPLAAHHLLRSH